MLRFFCFHQDEQCRYMAALCMHARGQLEEAARCYDALLSLKPGHQAWYTRECCVYLWNNVRRPWREFSPDAELDPEFKVIRWLPYVIRRFRVLDSPIRGNLYRLLARKRRRSTSSSTNHIGCSNVCTCRAGNHMRCVRGLSVPSSFCRF